MRSVRRRLVPVLALVLALPLSGAATAGATAGVHADIAVYAAPQLATAHLGERVTFLAVGANRGPDDIVNDSMDTHYQAPVGVKVRRERCLGVSPDTPYCEFGEVDAGGITVTRVVAKVTGSTSAGFASLTFCVSHESAEPLLGNNPKNDCHRARVKIVS
jgi:hypothetical protein